MITGNNTYSHIVAFVIKYAMRVIPLSVILFVMLICLNTGNYNYSFSNILPLSLAIFLADILRLIRFIILTLSLFSVPLSSAIWIYVNSLPIVFVFPYKIGEVFRLANLTYVTGDIKKSTMVILSERLFDAFILMIFGLVMYISPTNLDQWNYMIFNYLIALILTFGFLFFVCLPAMYLTKRFIFLNYVNNYSLLLLENITVLAKSIGITKNIIMYNFPLLFSLSSLIWFSELWGLLVFIDVGSSSIYHNFFKYIDAFFFRSNWSLQANFYIFINIIIILILWLGGNISTLYKDHKPNKKGNLNNFYGYEEQSRLTINKRFRLK